jgi:hypothetical protein
LYSSISLGDAVTALREYLQRSRLDDAVNPLRQPTYLVRLHLEDERLAHQLAAIENIIEIS